jgi:hypothetical protein
MARQRDNSRRRGHRWRKANHGKRPTHKRKRRL